MPKLYLSTFLNLLLPTQIKENIKAIVVSDKIKKMKILEQSLGKLSIENYFSIVFCL